MNYLQALFSLFNAPLFATFIIALFWKRMTPAAGFWGLLSGMLASLTTYLLYLADVLKFGSDLDESFWGAGIGFVTVMIVSVIVTLVTTPKPERELAGLVYGVGGVDLSGDTLVGDRVWYRNPILLGVTALVLAVLFYLPFR
jgi:SSS family solute:Na+ symporter